MGVTREWTHGQWDDFPGITALPLIGMLAFGEVASDLSESFETSMGVTQSGNHYVGPEFTSILTRVRLRARNAHRVPRLPALVRTFRR